MALKHYCICRPRDGLLYVEVPTFDHLRNLLLTQTFRDNAHFRTVDGSVPYMGGGIAFPFVYLRILGVQPLWYPVKGGDTRTAIKQLVEDDIYVDEWEAEDFAGHHYHRECEWLGPRGLRFSLDAIEYVWLGPNRNEKLILERASLLREILPRSVPIQLEPPEPTGIMPCRG